MVDSRPRTIAAGISNGGYLVRWQLENRPWLFDYPDRLVPLAPAFQQSFTELARWLA